MELIRSKKIYNVQSFYITNNTGVDRGYNNPFNKIDFFYLDRLNERLNKINYIIDNHYLRDNSSQAIKKVLTDLNLKKDKEDFHMSSYRDKNSLSLYESLSSSEKEEILEINYLDFQIYNQKDNDYFEIKK